MRKILPPTELTRTPRPLDELKRFKATEFKHFLLYYSLPILKDMLPTTYYKHWSLLVYAITKLNGNEITEADLRSATNALRKFVFGVQDLYKKEFMKYNVHLLLHLPESVKYFGALWAWSAFPYEDYNHTLRNMLFNSQCIVQQICKSYLRLQSIKFYKTFRKNNCNNAAKVLFQNLTEGYRYHRTGTKRENQLITFGKKQTKVLSLVEKLCIERLTFPHQISSTVDVYERFIFKNIIIHSKKYSRLEKRNNSIVKTTDGEFISVDGLLKVINTTTQEAIWLVMVQKV